MSVKIAALEAENVKRIKAVALTPSPTGLTIVGGNNNQGKTSVLDALAWALGGEKFRPTAAVRDGALAPCTDDWYLGNICAGDFDSFFHSEKMVEFLKNSFQLPPACKTCRWFTLCRGGGCKRNRVGTDYCRAYQTFFANTEHLFAQLR